jgi:hypothetical protein
VAVVPTKMWAKNGHQDSGGGMTSCYDEKSPQTVRKRPKRNIDITSEFFSNERTGQQAEGKYVRMTGPTKESLSDINPILLTRILNNMAGGFSDCRRNKDGQVSFMTRNANQARALIGKKNLQIGPTNTIEVEITLIESLNSSRGTIFGSDLVNIPIEGEDALLPHLKQFGVTNIEKIKTRGKDGHLDFKGLHVLTFDTRNLPSEVTVGFLKYSVKEWVPSPMKCQFCLAFGHTKNRCTNNIKLCRKCNNQEHEDECHVEKCHHCTPPNDGHESFSRNCPVMKKERRICEEKVARGISFKDARKLVEEQANMDFSNALRKGKEENRQAITNIDEEQKEAELILEELQRKVQKLKQTRQMIQELRKQEAELITENSDLAFGLEFDAPEEDDMEFDSNCDGDDVVNNISTPRPSSSMVTITESQQTHTDTPPKRTVAEIKSATEKKQRNYELRNTNIPKKLTEEVYNKFNETDAAQYRKFVNANPKVKPYYVKNAGGKITFCGPVFP